MTLQRWVRSFDLHTARALVVESLDRLRWRHHGAGMIQGYVTPFLRVHVWHPSLLLPGMLDAGVIHDHRFDLESTLLVGSMVNREYITSTDGGTEFDLYEVNCGMAKNGDDPVQIGQTRADAVSVRVHEGECYTFPRGYFHMSIPQHDEDEVVVSLMMKTNEQDAKAKLLAPVGMKPVHAFKECAGRSAPHHTVIGNVQLVDEKCRATPEGMRAIAEMARHALAQRMR